MNKLNHRQSLFLDMLRGISSLAVLIGHALTYSMPDSVGYKFVAKYPIQSYAVVIFFVLSGFLITYQYLHKSDSYSFEKYFIDRFSRIYTAFIPALVLIWLMDTASNFCIAEKCSAKTLLANLFMLHHTPYTRFFEILPTFQRFGTGDVLWTIAIEWWLYILFGTMFTPAATMAGKIAKIFLFPVAALTVLFYVGYEFIGISWFLGAVAALIFTHMQTRRIALFAVIFVLLLYFARAISLNRSNYFNFYDPQFMIATACGFMLLLLLSDHFMMIFNNTTNKIFLFLSFASYPMYLIHSSIQVNLRSHLNNNFMGICILIILSLLASFAFAYVTEPYHKKIRDHLKIKLLKTTSDLAIAKN